VCPLLSATQRSGIACSPQYLPSADPNFYVGELTVTTPRSRDGTLRLVVIALAVVVGAPLLMMVVAFPLMGMYGGMMGGYGGYGGMMDGYGGYGYSPLWGLGMMLVLLLVLVGLAYFAYRALSDDGTATTDAALDELRRAYARGELSHEEYETRLENLREHTDDDRT